MKLDIDSIRKGDQSTLNLNFTLDLDAIDFYGDKIYIISPVDVKGKLHVVDYRLYNLEIRADMQANCNRCLEPLSIILIQYTYEISMKICLNPENDQIDDDIIYYGIIYLLEIDKGTYYNNILLGLYVTKHKSNLSK